MTVAQAQEQALRIIRTGAVESLRLHLADGAQLTEVPEAIQQLMDEYGVQEVARLVALAAVARGVRLEWR